MKTINLKTTARRFSLLIGCLGLAISGYSQSLLTNGLVAYYPFNGNANDASGNGNHGSTSDTVSTTDRFGQPNGALYFNRTNSIVTSPDQLLDIGAEYTLSMWFCTYDLLAQFQTLVGTTPNPAIDFAYNAAIHGGDLYLDLSIGNGTDWLQPTQQHGPKRDYAANQWYHAVATKSGSSYSTYVNGVLDASFGRSPGHRLVRLLIGARFYGPLDDFRVYSRALSAGEVQWLFAYESGPRVELLKAVKPSFSFLTVGENYQMQVSGDLNTWTNQGTPFTATNTSMIHPEYFGVDNWNSLFFRLQSVP